MPRLLIKETGPLCICPDCRSVLAWAGDVEAQDAEADGNQASTGEIFTVLIQAQHEAHARDNPAITKKAGAPGGNGTHGRGLRLVTIVVFIDLS